MLQNPFLKLSTIFHWASLGFVMLIKTAFLKTMLHGYGKSCERFYQWISNRAISQHCSLSDSAPVVTYPTECANPIVKQ